MIPAPPLLGDGRESLTFSTGGYMLGQVATLTSPAVQSNPSEVVRVENSLIPSPDRTSKIPSQLQLSRGSCRPLGATVTPHGVNFAVVSRHAQAVHLLLFEEGHEEAYAEIPFDPQINRTGDVWHIHVQGLNVGGHHKERKSRFMPPRPSPSWEYGYRVHGPFSPGNGHRFNPRAILIDPYAKALSGGFPWGSRTSVRNRPARLGKIVADSFDWETDVPPHIPIAQTVIYELHLRGYTRHPTSEVKHPGTFLGLCEKIPHLKSLGITAVQLMPVLEFDELSDSRLHPQTGATLVNYWGYSPLSFFALKQSYASRAGQASREFKELVKQFHKAGIEVILDVVYNHTCEGNESGPTLSFRGLDNSLYYLLDKEGRYYNYSGCGNTLNCNHPVVRDLIIDSLVELVTEYHVDGFRFDLAAILGRGTHGKPLEEPPLLQHIAEHPILSGTKLIAEAWDAAGLSLIGKFPLWGRWAEFNGHFRDDVRRFVRSEEGGTLGVAKRISGSLDLYGKTATHSYHSVNFITCHDGFTLADLVTFNHKNNWHNGENNRDGWDDNISFNCGLEGPTDNLHVQILRHRQMRNFMTLMMISQGIPFLLMGDEMGRSQQGNNNPYCQDNEISWLDWSLAEKNTWLTRFTTHLIALRKKHFAISREQFLERVTWHGQTLKDPDWTGQNRTLAMQLRGAKGHLTFFLLFNAHWEHQHFVLPAVDGSHSWRRLVDTSLPSPDDIVEEQNAVRLDPCDQYIATPRSIVILIRMT